MKKIIAGIISACLLVCTLALAACGGTKSDEEQFNEAKQKFDNYTANININVPANNFILNSVLMVDGTKGKLTAGMQGSDEEIVYYYEERYGNVFEYDTDWSETYAETIEEASSLYNGFIYVVNLFFYDDFEKQGEDFVAKQSAVESYASQYDLDGLSSIRLRINNGRIISATVIADLSILGADGDRAEITYTFSNYGSTHVTLPA